MAFGYVFFFFFQAEDGIRDVAVTGVQTCALPICAPTRTPARARGEGTDHRAVGAARRIGRTRAARWRPRLQATGPPRYRAPGEPPARDVLGARARARGNGWAAGAQAPRRDGGGGGIAGSAGRQP